MANILSLNKDVLGIIIRLLLDENDVIRFREAIGRIALALEEVFFGHLCCLSFGRPLSEGQMAEALPQRHIFLAKKNSSRYRPLTSSGSLMELSSMPLAKREYLSRNICALAYMRAESDFSIHVLAPSFLSERTHILNEDQLFCCGQRFGRIEMKEPKVAIVELPFDGARYVSASTQVSNNKVLCATNSGTVGLVDTDMLKCDTQWKAGASISLSNHELVELTMLPSNALFQTGSHFLELRDLEHESSLLAIPASALRRSGGRTIPWRNPKGKLHGAAALDGSVMAISGEENLFLFDSRVSSNTISCQLDEKASRTGHSYCIRSLAFHPSRNVLFSGGGDGLLCSWDLRKTERGPIQRLSVGEFVVSLQLDCRNLFVGTLNNGLERFSFSPNLEQRGFRFKAPSNAHLLSFSVLGPQVVVSWNDGLVELLQANQKH